MDVEGIIEIVLDRGSCFGTCPVFRFATSRNSPYYYEGRSHVEPLGERTGPFPGYLFNRLAEVCVELRLLELDDMYPSDFEDTPTVTVSIRHVEGIKVIRNENGDSGPVRIWAFAAIVEFAMRQVFEIENRRKSKKR